MMTSQSVVEVRLAGKKTGNFRCPEDPQPHQAFQQCAGVNDLLTLVAVCTNQGCSNLTGGVMGASRQGSVSRARWAAIGAVVAVSLGAGGVAVTNAVVSSGDRDAFVPIAPCRLFDLRAPSQIGPRGTPLQPGETYTQSVQGSNGDCQIPTDATAVAMNATAVGGTADSYLTIWPSDVDPRPLASNLNWAPGSPPTPNKVDVKLSADGRINLFNNAGTVSVLADVVGYYVDHNHDDRYYTKAEIDSKMTVSANASNVYTKPEVDALLAANVAATNAKLSADITVSNGIGFLAGGNVPPAFLGYFGDSTRADILGLSVVELPLLGPKSVAGVTFRFKSMTYCMRVTAGDAFVDLVGVFSSAPEPSPGGVGDGTDRTAAGCVTITDPTGLLAASTNVLMVVTIRGTAGSVSFTGVTSTWTPVLA